MRQKLSNSSPIQACYTVNTYIQCPKLVVTRYNTRPQIIFRMFRADLLYVLGDVKVLYHVQVFP